MNHPFLNEREQYAAFVKAAQYITRLTPQQDFFEHLSGIAINFFKASWVAFAYIDPAGDMAIYNCSNPTPAFRSHLQRAGCAILADVLDSGFIAVEQVSLPEPYRVVGLPLRVAARPMGALIGFTSAEPLPKELLNLLLALSGMAETVLERLNSERELRQHRDHLEELVKARTTQIELQNTQLAQEILVRKETEESLRRSEEQIRLLLNSTAEAMYAIDMDGHCTFCNTECLRLLGYHHPDDLIGKNMHQLIHYQHADQTLYPNADCLIQASLKQGQHVHIDREVFWRADNQCFPVEYWAHPLYQYDGIVGAVVTFLDITERKEKEARAHSLAMTDALTNLANRRSFVHLAEQQLRLSARTRQPLCLIYIDLDELKHVNDTLGHSAGDALLVEASQLLQDTFREADIIARIGGDEFAVLMVNTAHSSSQVILDRLETGRGALNAQVNRLWQVQMSIGIVHYTPDLSCSLAELIAQADARMYDHKRAKNGRRNYVSN